MALGQSAVESGDSITDASNDIVAVTRMQNIPGLGDFELPDGIELNEVPHMIHLITSIIMAMMTLVLQLY